MRAIDADAFAEWVHANVPAETPEALMTKAFVMAGLRTHSVTPTVDERFRVKRPDEMTEEHRRELGL